MDANTSKPIVSWAGPLIEVAAAQREAEDLFEKHRWGDGLARLRDMVAGINQAVEFIVEHHPE